MNKRIISLLLALVLVMSAFGMVLTGCTSQQEPEETTVPTTTQPPEKDVAPETLLETVKGVAQMDEVFKIEDEIASELYDNLDLSLLEAYSFNIPMINVKSAEITILKVKNAEDINTVKAAVEVRRENVLKTWEHYLPDQYEQVQQSQIVVNGRYIMFIVAPDVEQRVAAFNEALK